MQDEFDHLPKPRASVRRMLSQYGYTRDEMFDNAWVCNNDTCALMHSEQLMTVGRAVAARQNNDRAWIAASLLFNHRNRRFSC